MGSRVCTQRRQETLIIFDQTARSVSTTRIRLTRKLIFLRYGPLFLCRRIRIDNHSHRVARDNRPVTIVRSDLLTNALLQSKESRKPYKSSGLPEFVLQI